MESQKRVKSDEGLSSSPDPLALSNENGPSPSLTKRRGPVITPRKPLVNTSGNTRVQDFYVSTPPSRKKGVSPTKSSNESTSTSPWRIRLTLQAEQINSTTAETRRRSSSTKRLTEQTTTITVPLKDAGDTPPAIAKRGRGRPRKSLESSEKRRGTPRPKAKRNRATVVNSPNGTGEPANFRELTPQKKNGGRPRKSTEIVSNASPSIDPDPITYRGASGKEPKGSTKDMDGRPRSKGRRKATTPQKVPAESVNLVVVGSPNIAMGTHFGPGLAFDDGEGDTLLIPDILHPSSRGKSDTSQGNPLDPFPPLDNGQPQNSPITRTSRSDSETSDRTHKETQEEVSIDPTDQHQEYDTVLESEGFSMVSVSSLASSGAHSSNFQKDPSGSDTRDDTPAVTSSPSVPPALQQDSSRLAARHLDGIQNGTPKLARVIRAGIALQGVLSPRNQSHRVDSPLHISKTGSSPLDSSSNDNHKTALSVGPKSESPKERLDTLFSGFGAGTRRELRAGLRLGEELAKRQRTVSQTLCQSAGTDGEVFIQKASPNDCLPIPSAHQPSYSLELPIPQADHNNEVRYPSIARNQLPTPERSDSEAEDGSMSSDEPISNYSKQLDGKKGCVPTDDGDDSPEHAPIDWTMLAKEAEWQREREAVSRQIEMANKSQVIVIDSDDENEFQDQESSEGGISAILKGCKPENDVGDIWQVEAHSVDASYSSTPENTASVKDADIVKPRRGMIPSPWRRSSQVPSTGELKVSDADLFWQPAHTQQKTRKLRRRKEYQTNHVDDVPSISFPQTLDEVDELLDESTGVLIANQLNTMPIKEIDHNTSSECRGRTQCSKEPNLSRNTESHNDSVDIDKAASMALQLASEDENDMTNPDVSEFKASSTSASLETLISSKVEPVSDDSTLQIDPLLLQSHVPPSPPKPAPTSNPPPQQKPSSSSSTGPRPPLLLNPTSPPPSSSPSLFSLLTSYLLPPSSTPAPQIPPATKQDLLLSSHYELLSLTTPWTPAHTRALAPLYYSALLYPVGIFPYNPQGASARNIGARVITSLEWSRRVTTLDCAVADAFMVVLKERGYHPRLTSSQQKSAAATTTTAISKPEPITPSIIVRMCVDLWVGMCMRGEVAPDPAKGEKSGFRKGGVADGVMWKRERDVKWEECAAGYFERKRREFGGLPSWRGRGVRW